MCVGDGGGGITCSPVLCAEYLVEVFSVLYFDKSTKAINCSLNAILATSHRFWYAVPVMSKWFLILTF
jgi:hypothetical protein